MSSQEESSKEKASQEISEQEGRALAMKLELLATVAQATVTAILRVVARRRSGTLDSSASDFLKPEERKKVDNVREQVEAAIAAVDEYMQRQGDGAIDLSGLQGRLHAIVAELEEHTASSASLPS